MAGAALMMANTSLSSKGPSRGRWCDSCMCHREACHSARCAHRAQNSIPTCIQSSPRERQNQLNFSSKSSSRRRAFGASGWTRTAAPMESANVPNISATGTSPPCSAHGRRVNANFRHCVSIHNLPATRQD